MLNELSCTNSFFMSAPVEMQIKFCKAKRGLLTYLKILCKYKTLLYADEQAVYGTS